MLRKKGNEVKPEGGLGMHAYRSYKSKMLVTLKAIITFLVVIGSGMQYQAAIATEQVHQMSSVVYGALLLSAGVVVLILAVKFGVRELRNSPSGVLPAVGITTLLAVLAAILWMGYYIVRDTPVTTWNQPTANAGIAAVFAIDATVLFLWSILHTNEPRLREQAIASVPTSGHDEGHETGSITGLQFSPSG